MNEGEQRVPGQQESEAGAELAAGAGSTSGRDEERLEVLASNRPRIYVASLLDYNQSILHGAWLDVAVEPDELWEGICGVLGSSPTAERYGEVAEEWAIHDYQGFGPLQLGEYESVEWVTEVANGITEHGPAFAAWANHVGAERDALARFEDCYLGGWRSVEEYAEELLDDLGATRALDELDDWLQPYVEVDVAGFARDLEYGGDITTVETPDGGVWVFGNDG